MYLLYCKFIFNYRFCDNVWTFMLNDVEFREVQEVAKVDKVKIVACDGKSKYTFNGIIIHNCLFYDLHHHQPINVPTAGAQAFLMGYPQGE
jgi:hypothetical protein